MIRAQWLILALLLFILANHADYLMQAYQHGWWTWLDLSARAPKWGMFDFIPHDAWHIVQVLENLCRMLGAVASYFAFRMAGALVFPMHVYSQKLWLRRAVVFTAWILPYVLTRGIAFSLAYKLAN